MKNILLILFLLIHNICFASTAPTTSFDRTPVNAASAIDGATYDDFPEQFPTSSSDVIEIQYRLGPDRETSAGDIYNLTYTISTDTYGSPSLLFECPNAAEDATNPTRGQIGNTLYTIINCKDVANTNGHLYMSTRAVSGAISSWSAFTEIYNPANTCNGWGPLVETSDANTYWWPISQNSPGDPIVQLKTTDGGATWALGATLVASPTYWSEASCVYVPGNGHICTLRNDNGDYVNQIVSTDGLGTTWTAPTDTNLGAATGVKLTSLRYDAYSGSLLNLYTDRSDSILRASTTKPSQVFNNALGWNPGRQLTTGITTEGVPYEINTTTKTFLVLFGIAAGTGGGRINDFQYQDLLQKITFSQIGP